MDYLTEKIFSPNFLFFFNEKNPIKAGVQKYPNIHSQ